MQVLGDRFYRKFYRDKDHRFGCKRLDFDSDDDIMYFFLYNGVLHVYWLYIYIILPTYYYIALYIIVQIVIHYLILSTLFDIKLYYTV